MTLDSNIDKIINHATDKFLSEGFLKITMDDIARELKMSKKTIYKYFSSKDALLEATINRFQTNIKQNLESYVSADIDTVQKLILFSDMIFSITVKISGKWLKDIRTRPEYWRKIDSFREKVFFENFSKIVEQGKKEQVIVDKPSRIILTIMIAAISGVINPDFLFNNNFSIRTAGEQTLDILLSGILTKKGKKIYKKHKQESSHEITATNDFIVNDNIIS
ncbi:MAG: TetR/AcrR family transcriptional regulator [Melioribacteraceae bacterium]|nr:TetR/AcrR family transcriptional regulator [Melioribacteraceae bacterium]MCF8356717.1 TetR/AcrR family transcriptional regulator [Melioribacteraceae bacterium]MCF8396101.1 TetR/AcrR family transcriptional regulator [Melioribacteraceae bacterium]MCF8421087.1 TetR/AcrR family transcriptional regulator [Melioribacteraceae bacterium]